MIFEGKRVLIIEGYARQVIPFAKAFRELGCFVEVLCNSKCDLAYWSRFPNKKIIGPCNPEKYLESSIFICELIKNGNYDLVVPLVDFSARILSENKEELSKYSKIASNDIDVFNKSSDKLYVMNVCLKHNIPCPKTLESVCFDDFKNSLNFSCPVVVKPRNGYGGRDFHIFDKFEDLFHFFNSNHDICDYVIQEYIPQTDSNISVSLFIDKNGDIKSSFVYCSRRWFPIEGGTGTLNELVDRKNDIDICIKLAKILNLKGLVGFDLIEDKRDGITKIIEINPRSVACSYIGFLGGINLARLLLEDAFFSKVDSQSIEPKKYGIYVRMSQIDVLWFIKSPKRWKTKPNWFNCLKTRDQLFCWSDPFPWFAFLFQGLKQYKKRKKT